LHLVQFINALLSNLIYDGGLRLILSFFHDADHRGHDDLIELTLIAGYALPLAPSLMAFLGNPLVTYLLGCMTIKTT
jgi:hypothetical protein